MPNRGRDKALEAVLIDIGYQSVIMFAPETKRLKILSDNYPRAIRELDSLFDRKTNIYIDWANVLGWQDKLNWRIDLKRLKQLLDSFSDIYEIKFYYGTLGR